MHILRKITAPIAVLILALAPTVASADAYATHTSEDLYGYGAQYNISTWLKVQHRTQDDGNGTSIEGAIVDTVAYCSFLNETGNKYVGMSLVIRDYGSNTVLAQWNWGAETSCRTVKDIEWRGPDTGSITARLTVVACVRGISGVQSGNDQQLTTVWRINGGDSTELSHVRDTNNQSAC